MKPNSVFTWPYGYDQVYICSPNLLAGELPTASRRSPFDAPKQDAAFELWSSFGGGRDQSVLFPQFFPLCSSRVLDRFGIETGLSWVLEHFRIQP